MSRILVKYLKNYIDHNPEPTMNLRWHLLQRRNTVDMLSNSNKNDAIIIFEPFEPLILSCL